MFIRINGIGIFAHHGAYEEEIRKGNHFEIDLEVEVPDPDGNSTDILSDILDYSELYRSAIGTSRKKRYNLLETFAADICREILESFPEVRHVGVKVRKLNPPIGGEVKNVEVEIQRNRKNA